MRAKPKIQIVNVVAMTRLNQKIDLSLLKKELGQICYLVERPRALCIKLINPKASVLLGTTGSIIIAGVRSEETAHEVIHILIEILKRAGIEINTEPEFKIINMVGLVKFKNFISLERTAQALNRCFYDPTQFSAIIYKSKALNISALIFASGKVVITGARSTSDIVRAIDEILLALEGERNEEGARN